MAGKEKGVINFISDMGLPLSLKDQIDRIDNNGDYGPNNCRWVSSKVNNRNKGNNRLIELNNKIQCAAAWIEEFGIKSTTFFSRVSRGWSDEKALTTPVNKKGVK